MSIDLRRTLDAPNDNQHIVLLYNREDKRDAAVARYLNEGLLRGQLCVYGSISHRDKERHDAIVSLIADCDKHVKDGNLLFIDLAPVYVAAMCGDLTPFEQARDQLVRIAENRPDKHIRFVGDCAGFLFQNRHFEECLMVEGWGQQKPFLGSYVCPYKKDLFASWPFDNHQINILHLKHDIVIDADEMKVLEVPLVAVNRPADSSIDRYGSRMRGAGSN